MYDCFTAELLLNAEVYVYVDHNQWYFCSQSCFPFAISHCHTCWPFVPEYTRVEKLTLRGSYWSSISGTTLRWWYFVLTEEKEKLESALIMLPWPLRSGTGRKPADTAPNWNGGIFLFLNQPQIMRFIVFYRNEEDKIIPSYFIIASQCLYSGYLSILKNHAGIPQNE